MLVRAKRVWWLFFSLGLPLVILGWLPGQITEQAAASSHPVIINEWSQGDGGSREWVELLVVNGPVDLRGWDLGDSSAGDLVFSTDSLWSAVPTGTLVVIYNGNDRDALLPPDDTSLSDCVLVVPHNDPAYFSGSWPAFSNSTASDNPHLRDENDVTVHDFSVEPGTGLHAGTAETAVFDGNTTTQLADPTQWHTTSATNATPGAGNGGNNSVWANSLCSAVSTPDLIVHKSAPATIIAGQTIRYQISLSNTGNLTATNVHLTDTLPAGLTYVTDDSGFPLAQPGNSQLVWQVGTLPVGSLFTFQVTATTSLTQSGLITNQVVIGSSYSELVTANNVAFASTYVNSSGVLIDAVLYDGYESNDADEAVALRNISPVTATIGGWQLSDGSTTAVITTTNFPIPPGQVIWLAKDKTAFQRQFGYPPDLVVSNWPGFANTGDEVLLLNASGDLVDVLVYEGGDTNQSGWSGTAVQPYQVSNVFGAEGQILYRKRDQKTGQPVADTNTAADWAQDPDDVINGRKVRYPGWRLDDYFFTAKITETAVLTVAIAPDNAYQTIINHLNAAQTSIQIETLTFENLGLADALIQAAQRGVNVTILLEGAPSGGLPDQEKYICQQLEAAGGQCWFMISNDTTNTHDRYRFMHAKFILIDNQIAILGSENLSPNSLPYDDKSDGTAGRRGVILLTNATGVITHLQTLFTHDFDPARYADLFRWTITDTTYGLPSPGFVPITVTGGTTYTVRYPAPSTFTGQFAFEIVQSPENSLRDVDGLLGLINQAGNGDTVLVEQLSERPYWGTTTSNPTDDPNPRLEAYINAARRGATVRLLLDELFDDPSSPVSNHATCDYVNQIAQNETLDLKCQVGNPAGMGIHNKMILAEINGRGYIHIGSWNGTEQSSKGNREVALQIQSNEAYNLLADMFYRDWPYRIYMPVILHNFVGPANHPLISEILYDSTGADEAEFIELANPTASDINLSNYTLGDAVNQTDFEDVRRFPAGTILPAQGTLIIARSAVAFQAEFGKWPDFEIEETDATIPNLIDDPTWGDPATILQLGNNGDEIILRDPNGQPVDVVTYGNGNYPGVTPCPLVTTFNHSLERFPWWRDTNNCDFREQSSPTPGILAE